MTFTVPASIQSAMAAPDSASNCRHAGHCGSSYTSMAIRAEGRPIVIPSARVTACGVGPSPVDARAAWMPMPTPVTSTSSTPASAPVSRSRCSPCRRRRSASSASRRRASAVRRGPIRPASTPDSAAARIALSTAYRLRGQRASASATSSSAASRTISPVYAVDWPAARSPPPPKQPHSICRPRAAAETIPARKTASSPADTAALTRTASPTSSSAASVSSKYGSP